MKNPRFLSLSKQIFSTCILFVFISCNKEDDTIITPPAEAGSSSISLSVTNIQDIEGQLWIALYSNEADWDADVKDSQLTDNEYALISDVVTDSNHTLKFSDLPSGTYAISMFHDLDNSGALETGGLLGLFPQEPYGFSNNFKPALSAPDFSDCSFTIEKNQELDLEIELIEP